MASVANFCGILVPKLFDNVIHELEFIGGEMIGDRIAQSDRAYLLSSPSNIYLGDLNSTFFFELTSKDHKSLRRRPFFEFKVRHTRERRTESFERSKVRMVHNLI